MRGSMWMVMTLSVGVGYGLLAGCGPSDAEKKAIHYGAEAFAKSEGQRIREDLGLPEDAG